uniref:PPM1G protein n=1 Tax=Homo sapiens TaxID=9606 RepID=Q6PJK3_HUMAN|nr:PPM1G protein [Homo sapiens]
MKMGSFGYCHPLWKSCWISAWHQTLLGMVQGVTT